MTSDRHAVLVFADAAVLDCAHRGWPRALAPLLKCNDYSSWSNLGFDVHVFTTVGSDAPCATPGTVHAQRGDSFGERLEDAVETLSDLRYTKVVIVGSDCPDLRPQDIQQAFSALQGSQLVLGPDHRGGCYLIGFNIEDRWRLRGIQWRRNTDFDELLNRFGFENSWQLPVKIDLDTWEDVRLLAKSASFWRHTAAALLLSFRSYPSFTPSTIQLRTTEQRIRWQLPPPFPHAVLPPIA